MINVETAFSIELQFEHLMKTFRIIVEQHSDGFVAYPLGIRGSVVGEGDTAEEALADVRSAIQFHIETFGPDEIEDNEILDAYLMETELAK